MTSDPGSSAPPRRTSPVRLRPTQVVLLVVLLVTAIFIGQNRDLVDIELLTIDVTAPLWLVLVVMVLVGLLVGILLRRRRRR